jgi:Tfp pilus assembly protein PilF
MKKFGLVAIILTCVIAASCAGSRERARQQADASRRLAVAYINQGNYTLALRELLKAEQIFADDAFLQSDLGFVYMQKNSLDLSIEHYKKALKLKPDFPSARNNLGTVYLKKGEWDAAIASFKPLIENLVYMTPQKPMVNLGWAYYNKKEFQISEKYFQDALTFYREGLAKDLDYIQALRGISLTYMATGRYLDAVSNLEQAVKDAPRAARLFFDLGEAYTLAHDIDKARQAYRKVIELAPGSDLARKAEREVQKLEPLQK